MYLVTKTQRVLVLGPLMYRLKLSEQWKIHPMFHTTLLKENNIHGPNYLNPPPDLIDGEPEYEVKAINAHRRQGRGYLYLIKWKDYPTAKNTWEPKRHLSHAKKSSKPIKTDTTSFEKSHPLEPNQLHMPHHQTQCF